jgi:hypothetical protein
MKHFLSFCIGAGAAVVIASSAFAEPAVGITAACPLTGPGIVVCGAVGLILEEGVQAANGKHAFGPNGEVMKVLAVPVKIADGNIKGSQRESGAIAKGLRATTGISWEDMRHHGVWGGHNSVFRKPFG